MDRTDYQCELRLSAHRLSELARKQLGLAHLSPQIERDLLLCVQHFGLEDLIAFSVRTASKRIARVVFSPKQGCRLSQFNEATIQLKVRLGASWWE